MQITVIVIATHQVIRKSKHINKKFLLKLTDDIITVSLNLPSYLKD